MNKKITWVRVWTGRDLLAGFLKTELEENNLMVEIKSQTESGLAAGFGTTGLARVFVPEDQVEVAAPIVEEFEARQES
jgi:hypothetical protein